MSEENKTVEKQAKPTPQQRLKELYGQQRALKGHFQTKRVELQEGAVASKREALSAAGRAMKELASTRDAAKQKAKELYDQEVARARGLTEKAIEELKAELKGRLEELHKAYEGELEHAREVYRIGCAPIEGRMVNDNAQIDKDLIDETAALDKKEAAETKKVQDELDSLNRSLNHTSKKRKANGATVRPRP